MNKRIINGVRIFTYIFLSIPFAVSVLWGISAFFIGLGIILPFALVAEWDIGFFRVLIYGILINLGLAGTCISYFKLTENGFIKNGFMLTVAISELGLFMVVICGIGVGWSF
jgi:hypothetical protein